MTTIDDTISPAVEAELEAMAPKARQRRAGSSVSGNIHSATVNTPQEIANTIRLVNAHPAGHPDILAALGLHGAA